MVDHASLPMVVSCLTRFGQRKRGARVGRRAEGRVRGVPNFCNLQAKRVVGSFARSLSRLCVRKTQPTLRYAHRSLRDLSSCVMELTNVEISCSVSPFIASTFQRDRVKLTGVPRNRSRRRAEVETGRAGKGSQGKGGTSVGMRSSRYYTI